MMFAEFYEARQYLKSTPMKIITYPNAPLLTGLTIAKSFILGGC